MCNSGCPTSCVPSEPALRELIQARVGRGKVECRVSVTPPANATPRISVNEGLLARARRGSRAKCARRFPTRARLSVGEVLGWPGVLGDDRSAALREACIDARARASGGFLRDPLAAKAASSRRCSSSASSA